MKIQIRVEYKDKVYLSEGTEKNEQELKEVKDFIGGIGEDYCDTLILESGRETYYFTGNILKESIITIIEC